MQHHEHTAARSGAVGAGKVNRVVDCLRDYSFTSGTIVSAGNAAAIGELLFHHFALEFSAVILRGDLAHVSTYFLDSCPWDVFRGATRTPHPWLKDLGSFSIR